MWGLQIEREVVTLVWVGKCRAAGAPTLRPMSNVTPDIRYDPPSSRGPKPRPRSSIVLCNTCCTSLLTPNARTTTTDAEYMHTYIQLDSIIYSTFYSSIHCLIYVALLIVIVVVLERVHLTSAETLPMTAAQSTLKSRMPVCIPSASPSGIGIMTWTQRKPLSSIWTHTLRACCRARASRAMCCAW